MTQELDRIKAVYETRMDENVTARYALLNPGELYMLQRREEATLALLSRHRIDPAKVKVLEIGCGRGHRLMDWLRWGAKPDALYGVELMDSFVEEAKVNLPTAHISQGSADRLPFADASFDVVVQSTVFTSILDEDLKRRIAAEMMRVLAPGGTILWYDFRFPVPWNKAVCPVGLAEIRRLFPGRQFQARSLTLLPPIARRLARLSFVLCRLLESFPWLRSHYLIAIQ